MTWPGTIPGNDTATRDTAGAGWPGFRAGHARELWWRRVFPGRDAELGQLRRWIAGLLPGVPARDDVVTVAVELATNAIRHTASGQGGLVVVEITWSGCRAGAERGGGRSRVRVAVGDDGAPHGPRLLGDPGGLGECGRGLHLVRALAPDTGVYGDHRGRVVWADVPWAGEGAAVSDRPGPVRPGEHSTGPRLARERR